MKFKFVFYLLALMILSLLIVTVITKPPLMGVYLAFEITALVFVLIMYISLVRPVSAIILGMDLLKGGDFGSRLAKVGQLDAEKLVELFNNMMAKIKNERVHRQEQNYLMEMLINASPLGIITLDFDGRISHANPAAVKLLNASSFDGIRNKAIGELSSGLANELNGLKEKETRTFRMSTSLSMTEIYRCSRLSFIDSGFSRSFFLIESLTEEVMKSERMAYEKVIRLIAHEVNNTVAGVSSLLEGICSVLSTTEEELAEALYSCHDRIEGLNGFITSYANLVRIPPLNLEVVDLNRYIVSGMPFFESIAAGHKVRISTHLSEKPVPAAIDRVLMQQVIVNIVKNSVESIGSNGEIQITTEPGCIVFTDNGHGISEETSRQLFSPFFSTKPDGQGIGLMFVGEVLGRHGFRYSLATSQDDGLTRFTILL